MAYITFKVKSNLLLYSLLYGEACNEFAGPISALLRQGNTIYFEEQTAVASRWQLCVRFDLPKI